MTFYDVFLVTFQPIIKLVIPCILINDLVWIVAVTFQFNIQTFKCYDLKKTLRTDAQGAIKLEGRFLNMAPAKSIHLNNCLFY